MYENGKCNQFSIFCIHIACKAAHSFQRAGFCVHTTFCICRNHSILQRPVFAGYRQRYIHGKEVQAGDRFSIVRLGNPVTHPVTKQKLGFLVLAPGELTILERKNEIAIAKINKSYAPISPGDMILPAKPVLPVTVPIRTQKKIEGIVVFSQEGTVVISEKEIVFIDRGSEAGVMVGDVFSIYQRPARLRGVYGEPKEEMKEIPLARVGDLVVVSVQPETSTAVVTRSPQPIYIGDLAVSGTE